MSTQERTLPVTRQDLKDRSDEVGECWIWKQGVTRNGYPQMKVKGCGCMLVRRVAAEIAGKPPAPRQPVDTTCGEKLCVLPEHMRPTTPTAVGRRAAMRGAFSGVSRAAKIAAARRVGRVKLSDEQVSEIRASTKSETILARKFGVHRSYIGRIRRGTDRKDYSNPWNGLVAR